MNRSLVLACAVAAATLSCAAFAADERVLPMEQARSLGVVTETIGPSRPAVLQGLPARVGVPVDSLFAVSAPLPALVEQVTVAPGDRVRRGQVLARLVSPEIAETQRGLLQAHAQSRLAEANLERDRKLFAEGLVPQSRVAASEGRATEARAALAERRQALLLAGVDEATIDRMIAGARIAPSVSVRAPVDGVVLDQAVVAGQRVEQAATLFRVARTERLTLEIRVPRERIGAVAPGVEVEVPGRAHGTVVGIGASVDPDSQSVMVRASVVAAADAGAAGLRVGELVQATLRLDKGRAADLFSVPAAAVVRAGEQAWLFVETPQGMRAQPVSVLSTGAGRSLVSGGLQPGARIAVQGTAALKAALLAGGAQ